MTPVLAPAAVAAQIVWSRGNSQLGLVGAIAVGAIIVALVAYGILKNGIGGMPGPLSGPSSPRFTRGAFRRAARAAGLAEENIRFLEDYGKALGIADPEFVFRNPGRLDTFFKDVYRNIDKNSESESNAEEQRSRLFAARESLTRSAAAGTKVSSTRQLGRGTPLSFIAPGEESYPSIIVAVESGGIAIEPVKDAYGEPLRFRKGTKLTCYFYSQGHQGYQFASRIAGWERMGTKEVMVLSHSDAVTALPTRSHARREMRAPCSFYRVVVSERSVKGKTQKNAKVQNIPFPGTIIDISAGGLGIQSANALPAGEFIKVEFNPQGQTNSAFAKVIRMNKLKNIGGIMHVQFVRISQRSLNAILSFVYGYGE
jgi:c-di-GMP-binding flagellar brake protein YcgR